MDVSLIAGASQSLGILKTLVEGSISIRDESKLAQLRLDMLRALLDLQQKVSDISIAHQQVALAHVDAQKTIREMQDSIAERKRYEPYELRPGAFVYAEKAVRGIQKRALYFCQPCYDAGSKIVLRMQSDNSTSYGMWVCANEVRHNITFGTAPPFNYSLAR